MKTLFEKNTGQALVTLLFFMVISIIITSGALVMIVVSTEAATRTQQGKIAYYDAESGIENAVLRLIRDPTYRGETMPIGTNGSDTIILTPGSSSVYYATSTATFGTFISKVEATITSTNSAYKITNWKGIY